MSERHNDKGSDPGRVFRELKDRPTPELDSDRLWQRVAAGLTPRQANWWRRVVQPADGRPPFTHPAYVTAGIAVLALATWAAFSLMGGGTITEPGEAGRVADMPETGTQPAEVGPTVVRLAPPLPDVPAVVPDALQELEAMRLGIRLVRGFSGAVPEDVQTIDPLAAGGADPLADVRPEVTSLPFEQYGLVGRWQGDLSSSASVEVDLSADHVLTFATAEQALLGGYVELTDVRLVGEAEILVASTLRLEPGRLYLLGVMAPGEDAPSIILAIRADAAGSEPGADPSTH